ncbi:E4, partial [Macaca fascicularis papillomavirus 10]
CVIPTLCLALPSANQYPLLKLLTDCNAAPHPTPTPAPAPRKTCGRKHRPQSDNDEQTRHPTPCGPWTVTADSCWLELRTTTPQGTQIILTVHL